VPSQTFLDPTPFTIVAAQVVLTPPPPPSPPYYIGKGLMEPCPPYAMIQVFGAPLGQPQQQVQSTTWNCEPQISDPTTLFDLSSLTPDHEVVVALYQITGPGLTRGTTITWNWYRDRDGALLFSLSWTLAPPSAYGYSYWAYAFSYSYIGYLYPGQTNQEGLPEIEEDGYYHVVVTDSAAGTSNTIRFAVTGIAGGSVGGGAIEAAVTVSGPRRPPARRNLPVGGIMAGA
jgi:hypothetical protein